MERQVAIIAGPVELEAKLNGTDTAEAVWNVFPISASGNIRGDKIRPANAVAGIGCIIGGAAQLRQVAAGTVVTIARA